jgi:predicted permease
MRAGGSGWRGPSHSDLKLAGRLLVKYPGLTIVGGLAMSFAICVGIVIFQVLGLFVYPSLPLSRGDRIVEIRLWDVATNQREGQALYDFVAWRDALQTVTELGAWRDSTRNLIIPGGDARPVVVAEMTASGFAVADGEPLLGRALVAADEQAAAPAVAVIGHGVWRSRFDSDPNVLGRMVQLGNEQVAVVGVMREGFAFPVSHDMWLPLRASVLERAPRAGPAIAVFGVLAPGATLETARAELTTFGRRAAIELPATHQHLQPRVAPYVEGMSAETATERMLMFSVAFFVVLLLILICGNVGLLLFARAATRESELILRTALGASRGRIVSQIFAEALVLGGVAAVVGLAVAYFVLRTWGMTFLETNLGRLPFWFDVRLSPMTVLVTAALTVLAACAAGILPALKITRSIGSRLKETTAGAGGLRFGGIWTVVIVAQVAVTVAFPAMVYWEQRQLRKVRNFDPGFAAERFLAVRVEREYPVDRRVNVPASTRERNAGMAGTLDALRQRVAGQPAIAGVTFVEDLPTTGHPQRLIEMGYDSGMTTSPAGASTNAPPLREATIAVIEPPYFDVLEAPVLSGRAFTAADAGPGAMVAIVDQGFVDQVLQGRSPIGQQVRVAANGNAAPAPSDPWYEVVGVVRELGVGAPTRRRRAAGLYLPATAAHFDTVYMMIHVRDGDSMSFAPHLRKIAAAVDPAVRLTEFQRANEVNSGILWVLGLWMRITVVMSAVALMLSLAGIHAVLSFTVSRRTREIALRVALGGSRQRVIAAIFRRPISQIGLGILVGTLLIFVVATRLTSTELPGSESGLSLAAIALLLGYATVMLGVCLLACLAPTHRALSVEPSVALRTD